MYNLTLQVADMSGDGLTATASAIISVDDVNDNAPEFTKDEVRALPTPIGLGLPSLCRFQEGTLRGWMVSRRRGGQCRSREPETGHM